MKTKRLKIQKLGIFLIVLSVVIFVFLIIYILRVFSFSKPDIYEIPETRLSYVDKETKYYMILELPESKDDILSLAKKFIDENEIPVKSTGSFTQEYHFMIPSFAFPVYFKENGSFWVMDDHVENYLDTNCVLTITKESDKTDYWFNDTAISKKHSQVIIIVLIVILSALCLLIGIYCICGHREKNSGNYCLCQ